MYIIGKKCGEKMKDYSEYFKGPNLKEAQKRSRKQVDHLKDAFEIPSDMVSIGKGKTYYIHTYGCQANERDGETLAGIFEMMGYTAAKEIEEANGKAVFSISSYLQHNSSVTVTITGGTAGSQIAILCRCRRLL